MNDSDILNGKPTGAIRASIGWCTTLSGIKSQKLCLIVSDIEKLVGIITKYYVEISAPLVRLPDMFPTPLPTPANVRLITRTHYDSLALAAIYVYPIKSCSGFPVANWEVNECGLKYDRDWVLLSDAGTPLLQKNVPKMCFIQPSIDLASKTMRSIFFQKVF